MIEPRRRTGRIRPRPRPEPPAVPAAAEPSVASDARTAAVAALAAAIVSGLFGYFGIYEQTRSEDDRARVERQQAAYSKLVSDEEALRMREDEFQLMVVRKSPASELTEQKKRTDEAYLALTQSVANVELVGSLRTARIAGTVRVKHMQLWAAVTVQEQGFGLDIMTDETNQKFTDLWLQTGKQNVELVSDFVESAREDLGT